MRLRADFWVSAYLRRCESEGFVAVLRRRGAAEAGAVYVKHDRLDGSATLYGPAPQAMADDGAGERRFLRLHKVETIEAADAEARLRREVEFDSDIWILEVESRADGISSISSVDAYGFRYLFATTSYFGESGEVSLTPGRRNSVMRWTSVHADHGVARWVISSL